MVISTFAFTYSVGKTGLVYHLAKDFNLQVLEINTSHDRSGNNLLKIIYEAT